MCNTFCCRCHTDKGERCREVTQSGITLGVMFSPQAGQLWKPKLAPSLQVVVSPSPEVVRNMGEACSLTPSLRMQIFSLEVNSNEVGRNK